MVKTFLHSGKLGDIIWALPAIKYLGGGTLYLKTNERDGEEIKLTDDAARSILSLLQNQSYIHDAQLYDGTQHIDYDLNQFRNVIFRYPGITIAQSVFLGIGITDDISQFIDEPWLSVDDKDPNVLNKILISRTDRYLNGRESSLNPFYSMLKERNISKHAVFVGTQSEHKKFESVYNTGIPYYETPTILHLAKAVAASKFYVGNENLTNAINESMKKISFLENNKNALGQHFCIYNRPDQFII